MTNKENHIAMIADFELERGEDGLHCITCLQDEDGSYGRGHQKAVGLFYHRQPPTMLLRVDHSDCSQTLEAILPDMKGAA